MNYCSLCNKSFEQVSDSKEHIIPQAIGGIKTVKGYICEECNNRTGREWDSKLAKKLERLSSFFKIKRERGDIPPVIIKTTSGKEYIQSANGRLSLTKPIYEEEIINEKQVSIKISARNKKEAIQQIKRAKKKYPKLDEQKLLKQVEEKGMSSSYSDELFELQLECLIGDNFCQKSIVKTALALAVNAGISSDNCQYAKSYLQKQTSSYYCFGYFYEEDPILNRPKGIPIHCVYVKGDPQNEIIFAYIELFGIYRGLVCLSDNYNGKKFEKHYAINPTEPIHTPLDLNISLEISKENLKKFIKESHINVEKLKLIFDDLIPPQLKKNEENEKNLVLDNAISKGFKNCGASEGENLNREHLDKLTETVMEEIQAWIFNEIKKRKV